VTDGARLDHLLDYLVDAAERAMVETKPALVCEILYGMVQRDAVATDQQDKRLLAMALRRLAKPPVLQAVARQLPRAQDRNDEVMAVLTRMGEDGADALIEQIATASQQSDRRAYFDALLQLHSGVPTLIHMLGDTRWFVARNAADLLGEMQAKDAEQPLTWLLKHDDDRVRRSATAALMRLGTPRGLQAIHDALKDGAPQMRIQAAAALVARQDVRTASALLRALEAEKDEEVQDAFLIALGRLGTKDAVQRLLETAEPERGFFKTKRASMRVAAVQGLAEARTPEALAGLKSLTTDKEAEVRDAATFGLAKAEKK
jgi:HEAT repeat protein